MNRSYFEKFVHWLYKKGVFPKSRFLRMEKDRTHKLFKADLAKAENRHEEGEIYGSWEFDLRETSDQLRGYESETLVREARQLMLHIPKIPWSSTDYEDENWDMSSITGDRYLKEGVFHNGMVNYGL